MKQKKSVWGLRAEKSKQKKHPAKKSVYVWGLQLASSKLTGDQYVLGERDRIIPEWWPTKKEASMVANEHETPVKIKISWRTV
jgi:hypothetical protein